MPGSSTDVRAWLREQGHDVSARGAIRRDLQDEYDQAHQPPPGPVVPGEILESEPDVPLDGGDVTGAAPPPPSGARPAAPPRGRAKDKDAERPPRRPGARGRGKAKRPLTERIFGGWKGKGRGQRGPRQPLGDFAEETWSDLAWMAAPIPPLAKILEIQAPYAGAVFDDQVAGTFIDTALQPVARHAGALRAVNGLAGPPVYVAMICLVGSRVQAVDPQTGRPLFFPPGHPAAGQPVMGDYDPRTKMLFAGLKYSLLQMLKIGDENVDEIQARTETAAVRNRAVDALVASIFELVPAPPVMVPQPAVPQPPGEGPQQPPGPPPDQPGFIYPQAPQMDGTGADPGRAG